ncbi:MAG: DNA primase [Clostridiales bacterium]|nr:DNA primase [Clostridiales bacterium]
MANAEFQNFIDEVIDKNDIADVISEYTKLKRVGNRFAALCPLHNDKKSPSLSISPDKQMFYCFGCGAGGNIIHFIMAAEHLDFMDALKYLADRAHIPMPEFSHNSVGRKENQDKKQLIYKINADAARYFYSCLAGEKGKDALAYLKNREIKNSTIRSFGMGYAPEGWDNLLVHLKEKGYKEQDIFQAGLIKRRDNGTYYDSFYDGRVMIPIINVQGNIIGFGGRIMTERSNTGKYLNSPETAVFHKKENLFGLNFAKNDRSGSLLLMEGYMDVISLHQAGITNAVASLGTAFTDEQARLIKRYTGKVVLCYDSDEAGKKATIRAGEILTRHNIKARVLTVTDGKDPDEFVRKKGGDMFRVLIERAKPLIEYRIDEIQKEYNAGDDENELIFADTESRIGFTEAAAAVLAEVKNPVEFEIYTSRVSEKSGVSIDSLNAAIAALRRDNDKKEERREERMLRKRQKLLNTADNMRVFNAEQLLLNLICDKSVYKMVQEYGITPDSFVYDLHKRLAQMIFNMYNSDGLVDINIILSNFDEEYRGQVAKILMYDRNTHDKKRAAEQALTIIRQERNLKDQEKLFEAGDLKSLDALLRQRKKNG